MVVVAAIPAAVAIAVVFVGGRITGKQNEQRWRNERGLEVEKFRAGQVREIYADVLRTGRAVAIGFPKALARILDASFLTGIKANNVWWEFHAEAAAPFETTILEARLVAPEEMGEALRALSDLDIECSALVTQALESDHKGRQQLYDSQVGGAGGPAADGVPMQRRIEEALKRFFDVARADLGGMLE
jgi:hypothetical protein